MILFDKMTAAMLSNKKLQPTDTEFFIRGRKLNIFLIFITMSYFNVTKNIRPNFTYFLSRKFQTKETSTSSN